MRIFIVLICSLGLVSVAYGAQQEENKQKKKQPQAAQHAQHAVAPAGHPSQHAIAPAGHPSQHAIAPAGHPSQHAMAPAGHPSQHAITVRKAGKEQQEARLQTQRNVSTAPSRGAAHSQANAQRFQARHFNLANKPNPAIASVKFKANNRIEGSQNWQGQQYAVFRNYRSEWHDQNWWHSHYHNNIVFVFGAPYYWNAGWWCPAWGYSPNAYYAWDGPIYAYNHLPPDQVIANVQATLQQQGYYQGEVDGLLGPLTRAALANYQRDHGLYETAAIDRPTLESLGMT